MSPDGWLKCPHGSDALGVHPAATVGNSLDLVALALGRETIDNLPELPNPPNGGLAVSDRGRHGNEGNHPGSDLHPEVITG